jgi:hypothetical protein
LVKWSLELKLLWVGWLILLLASLAAGAWGDAWWQKIRLDLRMISCLLLAVAAWRVWWSHRKGLFSAAALLVAWGMSLGFYGDSHVGERFWWPPFPHPIVGGIFFFGLGHLAYVAASAMSARALRLFSSKAWWKPFLAWQLFGLAAWSGIALTANRETSLQLPTLAYTLLVAATPGAAHAFARQQREFVYWSIGGALFFASDLLLAWQLFHGAFSGIDELTWLCYGGGQMFIVYGAAWAFHETS